MHIVRPSICNISDLHRVVSSRSPGFHSDYVGLELTVSDGPSHGVRLLPGLLPTGGLRRISLACSASNLLIFMVGAAGIEPATPTMSNQGRFLHSTASYGPTRKVIPVFIPTGLDFPSLGSRVEERRCVQVLSSLAC